MITLQLFCILSLTMLTSSDKSWGYHGEKGPDNWEKYFKKFCDGRKQSPIDLNNDDSVVDASLRSFGITSPKTNSKFKVSNDGHKVLLDVSAGEMNISQTNAKGLTYRAHQLHWHWGSSDDKGSEHTRQGARYPMEGHLVCWDITNYKNYKEASSGIDGLAVFGVFYQLNDSMPENPLIQKVIETFGLSYIKQCNVCGDGGVATTTDINSFALSGYLSETNNKYWRYLGSLTTPDCRENIMWTVFDNPQTIARTQIAKFRSLLYPPDGKGGAPLPMVNNYRNVKPLNPDDPPGARRTLSRSFGMLPSVGTTQGAALPALAAPIAASFLLAHGITK